MNFEANGKTYPLINDLRDKIKPDWREMLKPAIPREFMIGTHPFLRVVTNAEYELHRFNETLVNKDILEVGCGHGQRCYLMAQYEGTKVHGIDIDEYTADQSPDLNSWNPVDIELVHKKIDDVRNRTANLFPKCVSDKVTFETVGMEGYVTPNPHDLIVSWDTLEHIINLPLAFNQMANALKKGGIAYYEYNPFFALNGGHSLCTLDFIFGHCCLSAQDFERYIRQFRPEEEKIALSFYHKCLNRATKADIRELAINSGFEILKFEGEDVTREEIEENRDSLSGEVLETVRLHYPTATIEDLLYASVHLIMRKL